MICQSCFERMSLYPDGFYYCFVCDEVPRDVQEMNWNDQDDQDDQDEDPILASAYLPGDLLEWLDDHAKD